MSENTYKPRNYRIVRHITKNRILDIQDALEIGKLRIELVEFVEGEGATLSVEHYAEPDALALICYDMLQKRPWEKYVEFKGIVQGDNVVSRVLAIERVEARNPIKITVSRGPGKVMEQGAIQPLGKPEASLSVLLSEFDARRIAFTILRHLAAFEAATYHARVAAGTHKPTSEAEAEAAVGVATVEPELPAAAPQPVAELEARPAAHKPAQEPELVAVDVPAQSAAPARKPAARRAPVVENYWMAAERLGLPAEEAERILKAVKGDWGQAWNALRALEQRAAERN